MFKLPSRLPVKSSGIEEITDYIEWKCVKGIDISILDTIKPFMFTSDEITNLGIDDDSDLWINTMDDILVEMSRRKSATGKKYPFEQTDSGYRVKITSYSQNFWVYAYLLLSTRLNMKDNKEWRGIDGTKIFEELSSVVAKSYFGEGAESIVFGTALDGSFQSKIESLITSTGEGHSFVNRDNLPPTAQDDKLDVVVWKSFTDKYRSKLMGFGQCKTGTSWDDAATIELQPVEFCQKWLRDVPTADPVRMFFSSQYFPLDKFSKVRNAGLVFDRFRILEYLPEEFDRELLEKIKHWCRAAVYGN